jgi:N-methylhydantoinase A
MRLVCIGVTDKPGFFQQPYAGEDPGPAFKGRRRLYVPHKNEFTDVDVFDGLALRYGNQVTGPAIIEQVNTTTFVTPDYDVLVDKYGSYTIYLKHRADEFRERILS